MQKIITFSLIAFSLCFTGCSLFSSESDKVAVPTRDVPLQARSGGTESLRKRVMVLPFIEDTGKRSAEVLSQSRRVIVGQLLRTQQFVVINNSDFPDDLSKYIKAGKYDLEKVARRASSIGVGAIIEGKILKISARRIGDEVGLFRKIKARVDAVVRIRMAAARSGKEILNETLRAAVETSTTRVGRYSYSDRHLEEDPLLVKQAVQKAFHRSVLNIVKSMEKLSWEGRIAMVSGEKVYVNAGRLSGLQVGDILKVSEEGEEIHDPDTGRFIGQAPGRMKGTLEVVSYFGKDGSVAIVHSGSGFKENDRVELY